jgi:hypothetical protein
VMAPPGAPSLKTGTPGPGQLDLAGCAQPSLQADHRGVDSRQGALGRRGAQRLSGRLGARIPRWMRSWRRSGSLGGRRKSGYAPYSSSPPGGVRGRWPFHRSRTSVRGERLPPLRAYVRARALVGLPAGAAPGRPPRAAHARGGVAGVSPACCGWGAATARSRRSRGVLWRPLSTRSGPRPRGETAGTPMRPRTRLGLRPRTGPAGPLRPEGGVPGK